MFHTEVSSKKEKQETMTNITKHDTEKEGESNHIESGWIDFFVARSTIGDNDLVESELEFIQLKVSWWGYFVICHLSDLYNTTINLIKYLILYWLWELWRNPK